MSATYEVQQDNANKFRVIRTGADGVRRAVDNPPCASDAAARRLIKKLRDVEIDSESKATPLPWSRHVYRPTAKVHHVVSATDPNAEWDYATIAIGSGERLIGSVEMNRITKGSAGGWPCVDSVDELEANADLIVRAVNSHEMLVEAARLAHQMLGELPDDAVNLHEVGDLRGMLAEAIAAAEATE